MFVDNPFWFAILVSGVTATVLMLALWLGLDRAVARRIVLAAVIPAIMVAVPAAGGLPESARNGVGAVLVAVLLGGMAGAVLDVMRLAGRSAAIMAALVLTGAGWLVLSTGVHGGIPGGSAILVMVCWAAFFGFGAALMAVTVPDFTVEPAGSGKKTRSKKSRETVAAAATTADRGPGAVAVFLALSIGQGMIAGLFGLHDHVILHGAMAVALLVALIWEKAAPEYRAALWLAMGPGLMVAASSAMIMVPASVVAHLILVLVIFAGTGSAMIERSLPVSGGAGQLVVSLMVRASVLVLPVLVAVLVAYIGASMQTS
ncbi:hypothetical protein [Thalassospira sp.]|uniref:hypothetical protein n=1 Tax=Thalassospira sp. TaxID=1912094 RepID=UPI00273392D7|nr:hypothetical protein [Thalassospira sp.]MDP2698681.1 hypothetical protein [Thalassospira sp.]